MNDKWTKFLKVFLPVLFIVYLGGIITFSHVHIENGVTVVHSHPFKDVNHKHSGSELQFLHQISTIILTGANIAFFTFAATLPLIYTISDLPAYFLCQQFLTGIRKLRAPPSIA